MDIQACIQSGILEAYALGALPATEAAEVEALVAAHPALRTELDALQESIRAYAEATPKTPSRDLESRIWQAIQTASRAPGSRPAPAETLAPESSPTRVVPLPVGERRRASFAFARAAGIAFLLGSLALNGYLWNERKRAYERIARLEARRDQQATFFASRLSAQDKQLRAYAMMKELMADPAVKTVRLENLRPDAERASIVFQDTRSGASYLAVQKLPPPPPGKQYQLWVMQRGTPKGIALLQGGANAASPADIQLVPVSISDGEAFAISIENAGGSLTPTMDQIVMMGKVRA